MHFFQALLLPFAFFGLVLAASVSDNRPPAAVAAQASIPAATVSSSVTASSTQADLPSPTEIIQALARQQDLIGSSTVTVSITSGRQMSYEEWSKEVAPPLASAFYATHSAANRNASPHLPVLAAIFSTGLGLVGWLFI